MRGCGDVGMRNRTCHPERAQLVERTAPESAERGNVSIRMNSVALVVLVASMMAMPVRAQSLAQRVRAVGTGVAELHYTARPGTCGDGRESFSFGNGMHFGNWYGRSSDGMTTSCVPGPARVRLRVEGGTITGLRVSVGPARSSEERPTDLG